MPDDEPRPAGAPRGGGGWKVLLVFALGIGGGFAYLNRHRLAGELTATPAEAPMPDEVTLVAPRAKPVAQRPAFEVMPTASAPKDAGARKDAASAQE